MGHPKHRIPAKLQQNAEKKAEKSSKSSGFSWHNYEIGACLLVAICGFIIYRENRLSTDNSKAPALSPNPETSEIDVMPASSPAAPPDTVYTSSDKIHLMFKYDYEISQQIIPIVKQSKTLAVSYYFLM